MINYDTTYQGHVNHVSYKGKNISNPEDFKSFLSEVVYDRVKDAEHAESFRRDLEELATTEMASDTLIKLLSSNNSHIKPWEIGEAFVECALKDEYNIKWPWNSERDKRTPKASLPGADLVGFYKDGETTQFFFGEVKTSTEKKTPPNVVTGRHGIINQLEIIYGTRSIRLSLIKWLHIRCKNTEMWPYFQEAVETYLKSKEKSVILYGALMRDIDPQEKDLINRANALSKKIDSSITRAKLNAWYCPCSIADWPIIILEGKT